jgi:hypothetical protein
MWQSLTQRWHVDWSKCGGVHDSIPIGFPTLWITVGVYIAKSFPTAKFRPKGRTPDGGTNVFGSGALSRGPLKASLAMFTHDQPHREWEMTPGTQRNFTIGFVAVAGLVVLMNLLPGTGPSIWDQLQPTGVAHRIEMIRFG